MIIYNIYVKRDILLKYPIYFDKNLLTINKPSNNYEPLLQIDSNK